MARGSLEKELVRTEFGCWLPTILLSACNRGGIWKMHRYELGCLNFGCLSACSTRSLTNLPGDDIESDPAETTSYVSPARA